MVTVRVPATSANLGSGFDTCGIALSLYNTAAMEEWDGVDISASDGTSVPATEQNLIFRSARAVYEQCGKKLCGMRIVQTNAIPMARGLGSSSACIAAGVLGANALLGKPLSAQDVLDLAVQLEGHPDNAAPALLGGFVVSACRDGHVFAVKKEIAEELCFGVFIPDFPLLTKKARAVLPGKVEHADAVFNVQRAALLAAAFCENRYDLLEIAMQDKLHQPYRMSLIEGADEVFEAARASGAAAVCISGAGPTILAAVKSENADAFFRAAQHRLTESRAMRRFELRRLSADQQGAVVL